MNERVHEYFREQQGPDWTTQSSRRESTSFGLHAVGIGATLKSG